MRVTQIFFLSTLFFLIGCASATALSLEVLASIHWHVLWAMWEAILLSLLVVYYMWRQTHLAPIICILLALLSAFGYTIQYRLTHMPRPDFSGTLTGRIASFPEISGTTQTFVVAQNIPNHPDRKIEVVTDREPHYLRDQLVTVTGTLKPPYPDQQKYFELKSWAGVIRRPQTLAVIAPPRLFWHELTTVRESIIHAINLHLPEPAASLAAGLSIGIKPKIDDHLTSAFQVTNLTHLAAVSGANLSLTILVLFAVGRKYWLRLAVISAIALLGFYIFLVGGESSVLRAGVLALALLVAPLLGRPAQPIRLLVFAAVVLTFFNPLILTRDIGFQLSFLAFSGLLLVQPFLVPIVSFLPPWLAEMIAATLAATFTTAPIQMLDFGQLSFIGPIANILVEPLVPLGMASSFLIWLGSFLGTTIGNILAFIGYFPIQMINWLALMLAKIPHAAVSITANTLLFRGFIFIELSALTWLYYHRDRPNADRAKE